MNLRQIRTVFDGGKAVLLSSPLILFVCCLSARGFAKAQTPPILTPDWQIAAGSHAEFEVASIRLSEPGAFIRPNIVLNAEATPVPSGGLFVADFPLQIFIEFAWKIMPSREQEAAMLAHLPKWVATDRFLIQAKFSGNPTKDQIRLMMQSLLADRFELAVHFENKDTPVFALVLDKQGKLGPRMRSHAEGPPCSDALPVPVDRNSPSVPPGGFLSQCGLVQAIDGPNHTVLVGSRNITLDHLAGYLSDFEDIGRPIVNQTGLSGAWDFSLDWLRDSSGPSTATNGQQTDADGPSFLEALKDQLGLKLKPARASIPTLVIDHVERPSPN